MKCWCEVKNQAHAYEEQNGDDIFKNSACVERR